MKASRMFQPRVMWLSGAQVVTVDPEVSPRRYWDTTKDGGKPGEPAGSMGSVLLPTKVWWQFGKES